MRFKKFFESNQNEEEIQLDAEFAESLAVESLIFLQKEYNLKFKTDYKFDSIVDMKGNKFRIILKPEIDPFINMFFKQFEIYIFVYNIYDEQHYKKNRFSVDINFEFKFVNQEYSSFKIITDGFDDVISYVDLQGTRHKLK